MFYYDASVVDVSAVVGLSPSFVMLSLGCALTHDRRVYMCIPGHWPTQYNTRTIYYIGYMFGYVS